MLNLLPLVPSAPPTDPTLCLSFTGYVLTGYAVDFDLSADGVWATPKYLGNLP